MSQRHQISEESAPVVVRTLKSRQDLTLLTFDDVVTSKYLGVLTIMVRMLSLDLCDWDSSPGLVFLY